MRTLLQRTCSWSQGLAARHALGLVCAVVCASGIAPASVGGPASQASAQPFDFPPVLFSLNFEDGAPQVVVDAAESAIDYWAAQITGYAGYTPGDLPILFTVNFEFEVGDPLGVVAFASGGGPRTLVTGQRIPTNGSMTIDSTDIDFLADTFLLEPVIRHELGHILGMDPQWWGLNGHYTRGSGRYLGPEAIAAYQAEYDPTATFVPVQLVEPGPEAHWPEDSTLTDPFGREFGHELMSPRINGTLHLSDTSLGALRDIGWHTVPTAVPEPASMVVLTFLGSCVIRRRR
ncbi:MAG: hypothetical protein AAF288_11680 [Planctomycetota bacterium]